jgi:WhiB family transcriptional regulator, redox-sensing transcriptional regulator
VTALAHDRPAYRTERDPHWRERAACRPGSGVDPEIFHPLAGWTGIANGDRVQAAKAVCAGCPVRLPCLDWALRRHDPHAVLGGLTPDERTQITRHLADRETLS